MRPIRPILLLAVPALLAALTTHAQYSPAAGGPPAAPALKVATPTRGDIHRFVTQPGTIRALQQATLYAKVPGYLKAIAVDKGDTVKAGAPLAEIEVPELLADLAKARADVAKAEADAAKARAEAGKAVADMGKANAELTRVRADVPRAQAELDLAALERKRAEDAHKKAPDLVVQQQVDAARARHEQAVAVHAATQAATAAAQANVSAAQAAVEAAKLAAEAQVAAVGAAKANADRFETLIGFTRITAPFAGIVTMRHVDAGAFIPAATAGSAAQTAALVTLMDFSRVRVQVAVPEIEAALVSPGQTVRVAVEGLPGVSFEGQVTRHTYALDEATRTMLVEAELPNPNLKLRPGMYATVRVGVDRHTNVMLVPSEALVMEKTTAFLFLADGGKAKKTPVKIGFNDGAKVEVVSGLAENAKVILVGKATLNDGQAVNVQEAK
jgi:RND family efflux transporter MFP subunit